MGAAALFDEAHVTAPAPLKAPGETLTWQSGPTYRRQDHEGRVLAVLEAEGSLSECIAAVTGQRPTGTRLMAQERAARARYVVAVRREKGRGRLAAESGEEDFYAPVVAVVDNQLRRREQAQAAARRARQ